jgi:hypothetical protein
MSPVPLTHAGGGGMYGVATGGAPFHCIGSACMAWRWHYDVLDEREKDDAGLPVGYCGKAGEP